MANANCKGAHLRDWTLLGRLHPSRKGRNSPRFQGENFAKNLALADKVQELAKARGVTPAQLALAWVIARSPRIVTIPGTRSVKRLDDNAGAAAISLSADEIARIEAEFPRTAAAGTRYPASNMRLLNG